MKLILKLPRPRKSAFTLVELIMTIIVVGVVALPISVTIAKHLQSVFQSQDSTMAINLARFDLAQMNNTAYASIVSATLNSYQGYNYNLVRTVTFVNGSAISTESTVKIVVQVTRVGSAVVLADLTTYITKNVRFPY